MSTSEEALKIIEELQRELKLCDKSISISTVEKTLRKLKKLLKD